MDAERIENILKSLSKAYTDLGEIIYIMKKFEINNDERDYEDILEWLEVRLNEMPLSKDQKEKIGYCFLIINRILVEHVNRPN